MAENRAALAADIERPAMGNDDETQQVVELVGRLRRQAGGLESATPVRTGSLAGTGGGEKAEGRNQQQFRGAKVLKVHVGGINGRRGKDHGGTPVRAGPGHGMSIAIANQSQ